MIDAVDALSVEAQKFPRTHRGFGYPIRAAAGSGVLGPRISGGSGGSGSGSSGSGGRNVREALSHPDRHRRSVLTGRRIP